MKIQINLSDYEFEKIEKFAEINGYPDVISYSKDRVLKQKDFRCLWNEVTSKISKMDIGTTFMLRDITSSAPPSNLGITLYKNQENLCIKFLKKEGNVNVFIKV